MGQIPLDGTCRIARTDGALTFEVRSFKKQNIILNGLLHVGQNEQNGCCVSKE